MAVAGFTPNQQQSEYRQLSFGQVIGVMKCFIDFVTIGSYVFREANRIDQYMEMVFSLTAVAGFTMAFISIIFKNDKLFKMLEIATEETIFSKF